MNAATMERFLYLGCYAHEIILPRCGNMHRSDNLGLRQLPDMELVQVENALDLENRFSDFTKCDVRRNALEQNERSASDCNAVKGHNK